MDIREVLLHLRAGASNSRVQRELAVDRRTVKKYRAWARGQGLLEGSLPEFGELQNLVRETLATALPPQNVSSVAAYAEVVRQLRKEGVEVAALWERLKERGFRGSYAAVWRYVQRLEPGAVDVTVRVECQPGEEGQVDFGKAGRLWDEATGQWRKAWVFVMTLSWSRHQYAEFVFDQKVESWLRLHRNAFEFFGGYMRNHQVQNGQRARFGHGYELG